MRQPHPVPAVRPYAPAHPITMADRPRAEDRAQPAPPAKEPLWRDVVGDVLRRERLAQERTLKDVSESARISMPYLSELERGRKEASSEVLAAAAHALGLGLADVLTLAQRELARVRGELIRAQRDLTRLAPRRATPADAAAPTVSAVPVDVTSRHGLAARRSGEVGARSHRSGEVRLAIAA